MSGTPLSKAFGSGTRIFSAHGIAFDCDAGMVGGMPGECFRELHRVGDELRLRGAMRKHLPTPRADDWILRAAAGMDVAHGAYGLLLRSHCGSCAWVSAPACEAPRQADFSRADEMLISRAPGISGDRFTHTVLHAFVPQLLALRGEVVLHAACVVIGQRAHLFVGPSGFGKSTLATGYARAGFRVLAEDVVRVAPDAHGHYLAYPSYPGARLRDGSFLLGPARRARSSQRSGPPKQRVYWQGNVENSCEPVMIGGVHFLARGRFAAPRLESIAPALAMAKVLESTFMQALPTSLRARAGFERTLRLLRAVPCDTLRYLRSAPHFQQLLKGIVEQLSPEDSVGGGRVVPLGTRM